MTWLAWSLVIFLTALLTFLVTGCLTARPCEPEMIDPLTGCECGCGDSLPRAGRLDVEYLPGPPFAGATRAGYDRVDTGPLLILSDKMAANAALEREIRQRCAEAEAKIPPRWR